MRKVLKAEIMGIPVSISTKTGRVLKVEGRKVK